MELLKVKVFVKRNDVLVGKVITKISKDGTRQETDHSTIVSISEEGKVDRIIRTSKKGILMFKIVIAQQKDQKLVINFAVQWHKKEPLE